MVKPSVSDHLIKYLSETFPDKASRSDSGGLFEFGKKAGMQAVIDHLKNLNKKQQETR